MLDVSRGERTLVACSQVESSSLLLSRLAMAAQQVLKTVTTLLENHGKHNEQCVYTDALHHNLSALAAIRPDPSEGIAKPATGLLLSRQKIHELLTWSELLFLSIATNRGLLARRETEGVREPVER
jgi:hypothetical protein